MANDKISFWQFITRDNPLTLPMLGFIALLSWAAFKSAMVDSWGNNAAVITGWCFVILFAGALAGVIITYRKL